MLKLCWRRCAVLAVLWLTTAVSGHAAGLVGNSEFQQGLAGWTVSQSGNDAAVTAEDGAVWFRGLLGSPQQRILQPLDLDVSAYQSLLLQATVRVDEARLAGTGMSGQEAPLAVFVLYSDADGSEHTAALSGERRFWRGFYYEDPVPPLVSDNGSKLDRGRWQDFSFDLMSLSPRPQRILAIGAEASGWARRTAAIKRLTLIVPGAGSELLVNPTLTRLADGWQPCLDFQPVTDPAGLTPLPQGMRLGSVLDGRRTGMLQTLEADVSNYQSLLLSAEIRVDRQSLGGTGWYGQEAPLALFVTYTDVNGVRHDQLAAAAGSGARMFWHGWYILKPQPPALADNGTAIESGVWRRVSFDLLALEPRPRVIHAVGVEGSGRAPREASVRSVSLTAR
ncbi:MAG: hypothetical protein E6X17_10270 [Sporomusaceae bacterium]|nr:hypothetical protein [Sporomusaceae bacterium]